jgi:F0F1-type ATP synthase membrane subunit b/b'
MDIFWGILIFIILFWIWGLIVKKPGQKWF